MKQKLLNKLWLRVGMIVAIMTTALSGTVWAEDVTDVLTATSFTATSTTYTDFTNVSFTSDAVYAGNSAKTSSNGIQLRSKNSNSGIVSTTSGGKVKSVSITVESGSNTVDVYGSNTAYTAASDLYGNNKGTKLGSLSASGTVTVSGDYAYVGIRSNSGAIYLTNITIVWEVAGGSTPTCATPTFSPAEGTYTSAQSVTISSETSDATIYYTTDGTDPTTSSSTYSSAISVSTNTTIKAMAVKAGMDNSSVASATYTIVSLDHAGTEADPYTVADARAAIDANAAITSVYATGVVSEIVTAYDSDHGNITFDIIDEGGSNTLRAYRCGGSEAANVIVGDAVVVSGNLTKYGDIYEFAQGCTLESLTHPAVPTIIVGPTALANFTYEVGDGPSTAKNIAVSGLNLTTDITLSLGESSNFEMSLAEASGYTNSLTLIQTSGAVAETTVYVRMKAGLDADDYEGTITISSTGATPQTVSLSGSVTAPEVPATLPFSFDGGRADIATTAGLTQNGLGSDYSSSPKLKFDSADDYVVLRINERPGTLTFDIKGNGSGSDPWAGTFKVQASEDGTTYSDVATYITGDLTSTKDTKTIDNLGADVRYIKWIYTSKTTGNVALGNISLETYSAPVPSITVTPATATPSAADVEGTLDITYENLTISDMTDFDVEFCDSEGNELTQGNEPSWITADVAEKQGGGYVVSYIMDENTGAARTAYFKVFALGDQDYVYSNLVTVTQDAYVAPPTPGTEEWVETALAGLTSSDIFVIVGDEAYALPNDGGSSAPVVVAVTVTGDKITSAVTDNLKWNISGNSTDGYVFYPNGETDTWLYCGTTSNSGSNNNIKVGDGARKNFVLDGDGYLVTEDSYVNRYLSIYVNSGTPQDWRGYVNTASAVSIKFYKKVEATPTESVTVSSAGYATFASDNALDFTGKDIKAYIATANGTEGVNFTQINKVPANTGVLLVGTEGQIVNAEVPRLTGTADDTTDNVFVPGTGAAVASEGTDVKNYVLSSTTTYGVGFYPASDKIVAVGKAYISVPKTTLVKGFIMLPGLDDDATGISLTPALSEGEGEIYNLAGQRLNKMQKGINIVNGKKILK